MDHDIPSLRRQLVRLQELHATGALPDAAYEEAKTALERRVLALVMSGAADSPALAAPSVAPAAGTPAPAAPRPSRRLLVSLAVGVLVVAAAGYAWMGSPGQLGMGPGAGGAGDTGAVAGMPDGAQKPPHATSQEQIANMADQLAERMKGTPNDAEGWAMLARSYSVLGRHPEALVAYEKAVQLRQDDPNLLADYADSLAVKNGRQLAGEPMKWVQAALKIDPQTPKALALAGTHAFDQKDYAGAVRYWELLLATAPADNNFAQQVRSGLAEARQLAGLPAKAAEPSVTPVAGAGASVRGTVSLSPALAKLASPDDTVFIYARAAEGGMRMPLAIQRHQVKDLPVAFTLDDSSSMSPAARLSGVQQVIVSARVSKSGQAMPTPGDLTGQTTAVAVGASGLKIEINETVK